jgi:ribosomal protein L7/L12
MNEAIAVGAAIVVGWIVLLIRLSSLERRLNRLSRLDAKVDALLAHAGITFDEFRDVPADVREALERDETILAIKRLRQATGLGLKEAKDFVDEIRRRQVAAR